MPIPDMKPLPPELLCRRCPPGAFNFSTTAELVDQAGFVGQRRAQVSLEFGAGIRRDGYNLFVMGPSGSGKSTWLALLSALLTPQAGALVVAGPGWEDPLR